MRRVTPIINTFLTSPMVAFTLLGAGAFVVYSLVTGSAEEEILVTPQIRQSLSEDFALMTGREATAGDRQTLIASYVDDEILFREALAQGLHLRDPKIKHRLVQKMHFLIAGAETEPSEAELIEFYAKNADFYVAERKYSFEHVFLESAPDDPLAVLSDLQAGKRVEGEEFWLGRTIDAYGEGLIQSSFGADFAAALRAMPMGEWAGPVPSLRGVHYVRLSAVTEPRRVPFAEIRDLVRRDWQAERSRAAVDARLSLLKEKYHVEIGD